MDFTPLKTKVRAGDQQTPVDTVLLVTDPEVAMVVRSTP